jgi:transposase InsO family protein
MARPKRDAPLDLEDPQDLTVGLIDRLARHKRSCAMPSRQDCEYVFDSLQEIRDMTTDWLQRYNHQRPHESLGSVPPVEYRMQKFPNLYF